MNYLYHNRIAIKYLFIVIFFFSYLVPVEAQMKARVLTDDVKLRACEGLHCSVIDRLENALVCKILDVSGLEEIGRYGINSWVKVEAAGQIGYVYSALLQLMPEESGIIQLNSGGFVNQEKVNVRSCPDKRCGILFILPKGRACELVHQTNTTETIDKLGTHAWYFIDYNNKRGYIFGGLITREKNTLRIEHEQVTVYNQPGGRIIGSASRNEPYEIIARSKESELIRPFGRHYWYRIRLGVRLAGWIFGAHTSKANSPVDCQCVDFVKNSLGISGPTKHAYEWEEVLQGFVPVTVAHQTTYLDYAEVFNYHEIRQGDVAVFDKLHTEADDEYGHVAIVYQLTTDASGTSGIIVEGGNHDVTPDRFYTKSRCNNVSRKWYRIDHNVRFFKKNIIR